jgi:hypothetical protein
MFPIRSLTPQQATGNALAAGFIYYKFSIKSYIKATGFSLTLFYVTSSVISFPIFIISKERSE